ncbi:16779_t:CDS:2 [Acaulospora colombiana]|uniref:16779_t:CDS:1 n=1 Tax=Acaulospora colombiana TaxID=27376 RepID=A0ACA9LST4_9GLOM|nr:16779_t:CDS:2 [Acaulospora colombiana]
MNRAQRILQIVNKKEENIADTLVKLSQKHDEHSKLWASQQLLQQIEIKSKEENYTIDNFTIDNTITIGTYNVRGINTSLEQQRLFRLIQDLDIDILEIYKTKLTEETAWQELETIIIKGIYRCLKKKRIYFTFNKRKEVKMESIIQKKDFEAYREANKIPFLLKKFQVNWDMKTMEDMKNIEKTI